MTGRSLASFVVFVAMASFIASATDPNQLDNFCVAAKDKSSAVLVNGQLCKNPAEVTVDDFLFRNNSNGGSNLFGGNNVFLTPANLPGLNTLGISLFRGSVPSGGMVPPLYHARATELFTILEGTLYVGFVSFNQSDNSAKLFSTVLYPGDVFVFPQGLVHFAVNTGETDTVLVSAFSSHDPGINPLPTALFDTDPPISVDLLSKAFKLDPNIVKDLQSKH